MDGLFVVGPMNVMLYHQYNSELKTKFVQIAIENGLIEEQSAKVRSVKLTTRHIKRHLLPF